MSVLGSVAGAATGGVLGLGLGIIDKLFDRVWPDESKKDQAKLALLQMQQAGEFKELDAQLQINLAATEVNKAEAGMDVFRGGWRPFIGWVCGAGLAYQYVLRPLLIGFLAQPFPELDMATLMQLLLGMLGLGGMRTIEKIKGVANG